MYDELEKMMRPEEIQKTGVTLLSHDQQKALLNWGLRMFSLGQHVVADIEDVKYDGRLIVLTDGSRWEVDSMDAATAEMWGSMDRVVVIDEEMFKLDDMEKVGVQQDYS